MMKRRVRALRTREFGPQVPVSPPEAPPEVKSVEVELDITVRLDFEISVNGVTVSEEVNNDG